MEMRPIRWSALVLCQQRGWRRVLLFQIKVEEKRRLYFIAKAETFATFVWCRLEIALLGCFFYLPFWQNSILGGGRLVFRFDLGFDNPK